jgi:foldase protein PrsA
MRENAMKLSFRIISIGITLFVSLFVITSCVKHPASVEGGPSSPAIAVLPGDSEIIVARVNGVSLHKDALVGMMNKLIAVNKRASFSESREETRTKALDRLILEELAFQEATRQRLSLGEDVLDKALGMLKARLGSDESYKLFLEKEGLSEAELRSRIERGLLIQLIVDREVIKKTIIPEEDVRKEYERQKDRLTTPAKVTVEDVVLFLDRNDPALMTKANEILSKINADKDKDPKNLVADGTFVVRSLDIDKEKEPVLYDEALKLKPGELSGVIKTHDSVHIIQLTQYVPEKQMSFEEVKGALEQKFRVSAQKKRLLEWEQELKNSAQIETVDK